METTLKKVRELANEIEEFPLGKCSPSDDPEKQTAYLYAFRDIATRFVSSIQRLGDEILNEQVSELDLEPEDITDAYTLRANLLGVVDALEEIDDKNIISRRKLLTIPFVDETIIEEIQNLEFPGLDTKKLIRFCEELNTCYMSGNYISCLLLIRAVMNHIPPVFGFTKFEQVAAQSAKSVKKSFQILQDNARALSDLHNHMPMRSREPIPTRSQVEPYRASFEILMHEIICKGQTK